MKFNKKGQFFILSAALLFLLLFFIYSQETENYYISNSGETYLLENIKFETCQVGKLSNGTFLDERFTNLTIDISNYCSNFQDINCTLNILKVSGAPSNLSNLNYSHYTFNLTYSNNGVSFDGGFNC